MRVATAVVAIALAGCSVLAGSGRDVLFACVQPDDPMINPCESVSSSSRCVEGFCQDTETMPEACDSVDNDGDGIIDEGLDNDGDGYSWCPTFDGPTDCLDSNPNIHPPGLDDLPDEVCDGADNDCDGAIDEAPRTRALCGMGQRCYPERGGCDVIDCRDSAVGCPDSFVCNTTSIPATCELVMENCRINPCMGSQRCNPLTLLCTDPLPFGAPCAADILCMSNHCFPVGALELDAADVGGALRICSAPCCSDIDCTSDSQCWAAGTGARGCVSRTLIASGPQGGLTLSGCTAGPACTSPGQICIGRVTQAYRDAELIMMGCGDRVGGGGPYDGCSGPGDCETGLCVDTAIGRICTEPCGQTGDCPFLPFFGFNSCAYRAFGVVDGMGMDIDYLQICDISSFGSDDRAGCDFNRDCADGACIERACAKTCCADSQCGSDRSCRPISINGRWEMHCIP